MTSGLKPMPNIVCVGMSHHTAPVGMRERLAVTPARMGGALERVMRGTGASEAVILSTCNRVEIYAAGIGLRVADVGLERLLVGGSGGSGDAGVVYRHGFPHSVEHLFRVVCGLDSMVVGETEITGQVKEAYRMASEHGGTGRYLNRVFQRAFQVAKHARTRTGINRGSVSVGSVSVELAGKIFGDLSGCRVMVVGAGENSERTARSLISRGVRDVIVANRSISKARSLAEAMNGRAVPLSDWMEEIPGVDILIASTAAPHYIIDRERLAPRIERRGDKPLFLIDIAVPRDVAPDVNALGGVYLYDIDSLRAIADQSIRERQLEVRECEGMVLDHVDGLREWMRRDALRHEVRGVGGESGGMLTNGVRA